MKHLQILALAATIVRGHHGRVSPAGYHNLNVPLNDGRDDVDSSVIGSGYYHRDRPWFDEWKRWGDRNHHGGNWNCNNTNDNGGWEQQQCG